MKTVGLIGGMSWESTVEYYQIINRGIKTKFRGLNSAQIILYSVKFEPIAKLQHHGNWLAISEMLIDAAKKLEIAGADFLLICTNTMHKVYDEICSSTDIPILHIADATAEHLKSAGIQKVGLLGTKFTMEEDFYKSRLQSLHGIEVVIPKESEREIIHKVIYNELCVGEVRANSKDEYLRVVNELSAEGAQAVILGCTEIGMLISQNDTGVRLVDTTKIHAQQAVEQLL